MAEDPGNLRRAGSIRFRPWIFGVDTHRAAGSDMSPLDSMPVDDIYSEYLESFSYDDAGNIDVDDGRGIVGSGSAKAQLDQPKRRSLWDSLWSSPSKHLAATGAALHYSTAISPGMSSVSSMLTVVDESNSPGSVQATDKVSASSQTEESAFQLAYSYRVASPEPSMFDTAEAAVEKQDDATQLAAAVAASAGTAHEPATVNAACQASTSAAGASSGETEVAEPAAAELNALALRSQRVAALLWLGPSWRTWQQFARDRAASMHKLSVALAFMMTSRSRRHMSRVWAVWHMRFRLRTRSLSTIYRAVGHLSNQQLSRGWAAWHTHCHERTQSLTLVRRAFGHLLNLHVSRGWNAWVLEVAYLHMASMQFTHVIVNERGAGRARDLQNVWRCSMNEKLDFALLEASQNGRCWTVRTLVKRGAQVGVQNGRHQNALHAACFEGHVEVVKLLLNAEGTDVDAEDAYGSTALTLASLRGHIDVIRLLIDAGATED